MWEKGITNTKLPMKGVKYNLYVSITGPLNGFHW